MENLNKAIQLQLQANGKIRNPKASFLEYVTKIIRKKLNYGGYLTEMSKVKIAIMLQLKAYAAKSGMTLTKLLENQESFVEKLTPSKLNKLFKTSTYKLGAYLQVFEKLSTGSDALDEYINVGKSLLQYKYTTDHVPHIELSEGYQGHLGTDVIFLSPEQKNVYDLLKYRIATFFWLNERTLEDIKAYVSLRTLPRALQYWDIYVAKNLDALKVVKKVVEEMYKAALEGKPENLFGQVNSLDGQQGPIIKEYFYIELMKVSKYKSQNKRNDHFR
ncbi:hypothetical protein DdX_21907 [Ditylenchus destructor]|uniref:Uncharacterized protein n=1 Tax=Ditylenchus destructor TaxID=166010 RepID=A0AAD4MIW2_9BILA|nr:hypothetical protein DdX_21907 [Ditylenchus destructor]